MRGHWAMEITFVHLGEFGRAIEHYEQALRNYDPSDRLEDGFFYAPEPGVVMLCFAAWALWFLGQPDTALERIREALARAHAVTDPLSLAHTHYFAAVIHQFRREPQLALEQVDHVLAIAREHGMALYPTLATVIRGWALVEQDAPDEGIQLMRECLATLQTTNAVLVRPHYLGLLGGALRSVGQTEEGLSALDEGIALAETTAMPITRLNCIA